MKKLQNFSFHLHWITLCCFLLPFFYDSCSNEKKPEDASADSTAMVIPVDTLTDSISLKNTLLNSANTSTIDTTTVESKNQKDELLSETIIKKYPIFTPILIPSTGTHTGLATIVNTFQYVCLFAATIAFLLLLIGVMAKLIDKKAIKIILLLDVFATAFLFIACPPFFGHDKLWGYWLCIVCISMLTILDAYIVFKKTKKPS